MENNGNSNGNGGNIDLLGWDTVFAMSLDALNASIVSQKTTPPKFLGTDSEGGAKVEGSWKAWSVTGGEGNGIFINCPVDKGTLTVTDSPSVPLDGAVVEVMITLAKNKAKEELPDKTAKPGTGATKVFQANPTSDSNLKPRVQNITGVKGIYKYAAEAAFNAYYQSNLGAFDAVFGAVRLEEEAVEEDKQWLKPVDSLYALATRKGTQSGEIKQAFAILSLTHPPKGDLPQQGFDIRMFDPFIQTKTRTNSVFAVSAPLAMQNIVAKSAQHCVMGSTIDDFHIVNNGITVANKNTLKWGKFQLKKDSPATVTPIIKPGDFQLTLDGMDFHLSISQAAFTTPDGTADIKLTADQYFNMGAVKLKDGKYYFTPDKGLGTNSIRADVTPNKNFEIASIIESIVLGIAFGFIGGSIGEALGDAVSSTVDAGEGIVNASEEAIEDAINEMPTEETQLLEDTSVSDAIDSISSDGEDTQGKAGIFSNKFKVWGGVIGGLFAIPIGILPQIMDLIWNENIHQGNVPTVDQFATNFTGAIQWPQVKTWQVTGGTFRAAFLLSGNSSKS